MLLKGSGLYGHAGVSTMEGGVLDVRLDMLGWAGGGI